MAEVQYYSAAQVDTQIANAVAGIDLSPYYTLAQTDAAITAALVPVTLSNAPAWGANPPIWKVLEAPTCCGICGVVSGRLLLSKVRRLGHKIIRGVSVVMTM